MASLREGVQELVALLERGVSTDEQTDASLATRLAELAEDGMQFEVGRSQLRTSVQQFRR